jgi:hypothetical protein
LKKTFKSDTKAGNQEREEIDMAEQTQKQETKKQYTPEETAKFRKEQHEKKLQKASEKDTSVVSITTIEAADTTQFIDKMDYTMNKLRMTFGSRRSTLTSEDFKDVADFVGSINNQINLFLSKANKLVGLPYRPPRGFIDLTKPANLDRAAAELDETINILTSEREALGKLIDARDVRQAKIESDESAQKANAAAAAVKKASAKTPAKTVDDSEAETLAAAA